MGLINKILGKDADDKSQGKKIAKAEPKAEVKVAVDNKITERPVVPELAKEKDVNQSEVKTPKAEKVPAKKIIKRIDSNAYKVLLEPVVTEKATDLVQFGKYCFKVAPKANKMEVAKSIMNVYGVKPIKVNFIKQKGRKTRYGRTQGRTKGYKKAIISLSPGDKIELYEGV